MIKDFSTIFWGYLPPTKEPYKAHEKVNAFIGPSGHGKTTIWDGLRLMLGAGHFESKRTFSFYVYKKSNWAVVRVAFFNLPTDGIRPFSDARKFKDEVTACCRIYKNEQGSWSREYYLFDGEFYDLKDLHFNAKSYSEAMLAVGEYLQILEQCLGITKEFRNLMAMSPDTVREVVNASPRALFNLIFDLKGVKDYKRRYDDSKERLSEQEIAIERAEEEMREARLRYEESKQKAQKFRLYQAKEREVEVTELKLGKLEYFESQQALEAANESIQTVGEQIKAELDKANELTVKIEAKEKEIESLGREYTRLDKLEAQADKENTQYEKDKTSNNVKMKNLDKQIQNLREIEPQSIEDLIQLEELLTEDVANKNKNFFKAQDKFNQLKEKLSDLEKDLLPYKPEAKRFREILESNKIPFIMLADAIGVKPEMKKWQKAIEAYIGNNRYRVIVESDHYLITKKLQQKVKYGARVSLPKNADALPYEKNISHPSIHSAINITYSEKVEGYLKKLNDVYLVETVEEGHALQANGIESITIEGLLQDDDGAIHLKYYDLCCGKLAIEEEKKRTRESFLKQEEIVEGLKRDISKLQNELNQVANSIKDQKLLMNLPAMEQEYQILVSEENELSHLIAETGATKSQAKQDKMKTHQKQIDVNSEKVQYGEWKTQALDKAKELKKQYDGLQTKLNTLESALELSIKKVHDLNLSEDDIAFISCELQGSAFKDTQGNLLTVKDLQGKLNNLFQEKEKLYDSSVNEEIVRLVKAQEGQVELLEQNLRKLKEDRNDVENTCNDLLFQFRNHIKEIMKDYIAEFETFADLLKASAKGKLNEVTPEPETWEIQLSIGYDGKEPVLVDGPHLSSGQKASTSLMILLAALSDRKNGKTAPIMFLDEPKARVDDDRGNEIGQLLQITDIQYFITHQQGESLKTIDWIDHAFSCSACEPGKDFANQLILKKRARRIK